MGQIDGGSGHSRLDALRNLNFKNPKIAEQLPQTNTVKKQQTFNNDKSKLSDISTAPRPNLKTLMILDDHDLSQQILSNLASANKAKINSTQNSSGYTKPNRLLTADDLNNRQLSKNRPFSNIHNENPGGIRVPQQVYDDFPKLQILDGILKVEDYDNPDVKKLVSQLAKYPTNILSALKDKGLKEIEVANLTTPDMGSNEDLKGVAPRNWPAGSTWENVPGAYNPGTKTVVAGSAAAHGSESLLIHETGHAIGHLLKFNDSSELTDAHQRLFDKINPYLKGIGGPGNEAGKEELFAEGLAILIEDGEDKAVKTFDRQFVDFLKNKVLQSS